MFSSRKSPQPSLISNLVENHRRGGMLVLENSSVPLIPNFPSHKKSDGHHALMLRHQKPPIEEG
jgi:hypothetical protein